MRQSGGLGEEMAGAGAALALKRPRVERHVCARGRRGRSQRRWALRTTGQIVTSGSVWASPAVPPEKGELPPPELPPQGMVARGQEHLGGTRRVGELSMNRSTPGLPVHHQMVT